MSILQPILSGDPTLPQTLGHNLAARSTYAREFLWLVDEDDAAGQEICAALIAAYPGVTVRLLLQPAPPQGVNPKTFKLVNGLAAARGDVICVLDDDTMLPDGGLEQCLPYLNHPGAGLAFGLPYQVNFSNAWSSLIALFVNANSLPTYVPYASLHEPVTINGMFYALRRSVLDEMGGFKGLEPILADDFAVAQRVRSHGLHLVQTPLRHAISTQVPSLRRYLSLMQRWFIFPRVASPPPAVARAGPRLRPRPGPHAPAAASAAWPPSLAVTAARCAPGPLLCRELCGLPPPRPCLSGPPHPSGMEPPRARSPSRLPPPTSRRPAPPPTHYLARPRHAG